MPFAQVIATLDEVDGGPVPISESNPLPTGGAALGAKTDAAVVNPALAASLIALTKGLLTELLLLAGYQDGQEALLTAIDGHVDGVETLLAGGLPAALGQGTMAQSLKAVLASDQSAIPIIPSALATSVGLDTFRSLVATNTALAVKGSAGRLHYLDIKNRHNADIYVHFYDLATGGVTPTTTVPKWSAYVPASGARDGALPIPIAFATAITIVVCTEPNPDGGAATAPGTLPVINIGYK